MDTCWLKTRLEKKLLLDQERLKGTSRAHILLLLCCHSLRNALQLKKMIRSIRHKGLKRLYEDDDPRGVMIEHTQKLRDIIARLDAAGTVADMNLLKGELKGFWSVTVRANWRVIFRFADRDA
jgi:toxin HigB-1